MKNIALMGFMGAGKTTVGKSLAKSLSWEFIDTDERIEKEHGWEKSRGTCKRNFE